MTNNLAWFVLAACLLMPLLAGLLIPRLSSGPNGANSPGQAAPSQAHIGEPAVQESVFYPSPPNGLLRGSSPKFQTEPPKPQSETMQANGDATFTNLESPNNSQDLNQNRDWARKFPIAALDWAQNATNGADLTVALLNATKPVETR